MATNPNSKGLWEKTIQLASGGFIRIEVVGHPLDMAEDDRTFVEGVVDRIKEYEDDAKKYGKPALCQKPGRSETLGTEWVCRMPIGHEGECCP